LRDMAEVWKAIGRADLYEDYRPLADQLKAAIDKGMADATTDMPDGSLFVPRAVYTGEQPYRAITETRIGSYWNLVMPYGFASGYWPMDGPKMGRIVDYMHNYGGLFLGLLRFNLLPHAYWRIPCGRASGLLHHRRRQRVPARVPADDRGAGPGRAAGAHLLRETRPTAWRETPL
jgi:hypothetical protein